MWMRITGCSFLIRPGLRSWNGLTPPGLPVILVLVEHGLSSINGSGGPALFLMSRPLSPHAWCAQSKTPWQALSGPLQPLPVPHRSWYHISLDFVSGLSPSDGNTTILTVVDRFSKATYFHPLSEVTFSQGDGPAYGAACLPNPWLPDDIVSDQGPQFSSQFWKTICTLIGSSASLSCGFHPQSNGQSERANQDMETALRCLVASNPSTWSWQLVWEEYARNTLPCSATGLSPFRMLHRVSASTLSRARSGGQHTFSRDVHPPQSVYLEKSLGGSSQDYLQVSLTSGTSPDSGSSLLGQAEGMVVHSGPTPPGRIP
jgi:hypothetical protein